MSGKGSRGTPETRRRKEFARRLAAAGATDAEVAAGVALWSQHRRRVHAQRAASAADWHRRHPGVRRSTADLVVALTHQAAIEAAGKANCAAGVRAPGLAGELLALVRRQDRRAA